ncbi:MAG: cell division protein FtsZ [Methyloprofundus sp.]|nr:cell division protein FtsZ [Methyloprofundus sp.]
MKYELMDLGLENAVIKVVGVGGGGGNAVNYMQNKDVEGVEFICANTDAQALRRLDVESVIQLGAELTQGLGAGTNPEVGREAAEENKDLIRDVLEGANMLFLTAGMGGGTGTGAIPVIAEIAKELNILTVAVVTKPFDFEGNKKQQVAELGIAELEKSVDSLIIIPNQKLLPVLGANASMNKAFAAVNDVLLDAVQGITELITSPGIINVDFADVKTVMSDMGAAIMGTGQANGENRARVAAEKAISCPLLEDINVQGARGILVNISAVDMGISEFDEVGRIVHELASEDAIIKIGTAVDETLGDDIKVTVVVTGMGTNKATLAKPVKLVPPAVTTATVTNTGTDYSSFDTPTATRKSTESRETRFGAQPKNNTDMDYLDIPAFLRRQAD